VLYAYYNINNKVVKTPFIKIKDIVYSTSSKVIQLQLFDGNDWKDLGTMKKNKSLRKIKWSLFDKDGK